MSITVLAIDPGYDRMGVCVIKGPSGNESLIHSNCIETNRSESPQKRLSELGNNIQRLIVEYRPDAIALETLFFNKNVSTAIRVAEARGVILYLATQYGCAIHEFSPQQVKVSVTGYGKSDKRAVQRMIQLQLQQAPPRARDDEYDAIAVGITCLAHYSESG